MRKIALFDIDGVLNNAERFSVRYSEKFNISIDTLLPFFKNEFQDCLDGKKDLKDQLLKIKSEWKFSGSVDDLLAFWFEGEININKDVLKIIETIRKGGYIVVSGTNQEKYRTDYLKAKLNLDQIFNKTYSSAEIGFKKPDESFYRYIINDLKADFRDVVYWDDDEDNIIESKKLGIKSYLFSDSRLLQEQVEIEFKIKL